jgi:hypothetical protein
MVRSWRTDLLRLGRSKSTAAKLYRLLRSILNTAVNDDRLLRENPCRMRVFDKEPTSERATASVDQVWRLAALMPRRFRVLVISPLSRACVGVSWWLWLSACGMLILMPQWCLWLGIFLICSGVAVAARAAAVTEVIGWAMQRGRRVWTRTATKNQLLSQLDRCFPGLTVVLSNVGHQSPPSVAADFADPRRLVQCA